MASGKHILVVEDERDLAQMLGFNLERAGYTTTIVHDGRQALRALSERVPDLVVLDVMMPELSGTEVAARVRTNPQTAQLPIIMLTAKGEEVDQIVGLASGADDYVTKPFSVKVLLARIEAVLRRSTRVEVEDGALTLGPVRVDTDTHETMVDGRQIKMTLTEFRLLAALIEASGRVLSRRTLMTRAMGPGVTVTERTIDVHITSIRKKLGQHGSLVRTVRGVGYRASLDADAGDEV